MQPDHLPLQYRKNDLLLWLILAAETVTNVATPRCFGVADSLMALGFNNEKPGMGVSAESSPVGGVMTEKLNQCGTDLFRSTLFLFLCLFVGGVVFNSSRAKAEDKRYDEAMKDRFLREAPTAWEEYSKKTARLQGRFSFQLSQTLGNAKAKDLYELKKGSRGRTLLLVTTERTLQGKNTRTTGEVFGSNPDYGFTLKRNHLAMPWILTALIDRQNEPNSVFKSHKLDETIDSFTNDLVWIYKERLATMAQQPEFRVIGCRTVHLSGDNLVEVTFDYSHDVKPGGNPVQGGTLVLDPQRFWSLRYYDVRIRSDRGQGTLKFKVLKWHEMDGLPVPDSAVLETDTVINKIQNQQKWEYTYELRVPDSLPLDSEFTLSAFGLPEPQVTRPGIPWYLWAASLGVCFLSVGVFFRWRARRTEPGA